jgi:hypothetical protein
MPKQGECILCLKAIGTLKIKRKCTYVAVSNINKKYINLKDIKGVDVPGEFC